MIYSFIFFFFFGSVFYSLYTTIKLRSPVDEKVCSNVAGIISDKCCQLAINEP